MFGRKVRISLGFPIWPSGLYGTSLFIKGLQKKLQKIFTDLGLLYNDMSGLGRIIKKKQRFGSKSISQQVGAPPAYDLRFFSNSSWLGVPFYHFMSNWEETGPISNFTNTAGGPAQIGDQVESWKNTYLQTGQGDAVVDQNAYQVRYPVLREKTYTNQQNQTKTLKGLEFTGTEYLQIDGATVSDAYGVPAPIFSTGGAPWAGNTGATFMFVIDSNFDFTSDNTHTSPTQSLIYSRQPNLQGVQPVDIPVPWPNTEDLGIQYLRNGRPTGTALTSTSLAVGPQAAWMGLPYFGTALTRSPVVPGGQGFGGSDGVNIPGDLENPFQWEFGGGCNFTALWANPGLQVILLEYDNLNKVKHQDAPGAGDRAYFGPSVKIYGMSKPNPFGDSWNGFDLTVPKVISTNPMLRDHTLFDVANLFLGGVPAIRLEDSNGQQYGNGFKGVIYEVMMLEGILSTSDKQRLQKILERKYPLEYSI